MGLNAENRTVIRQSKADEERRFREMNEKIEPSVEEVDKA